jgi:hypothetical protein
VRFGQVEDRQACAELAAVANEVRARIADT